MPFAFLLACVVIELTPGPNMAYLAALSSLHGLRAGFSLVAGIACGLLVMGIAAAFGAAVLVAESATLYHLLRSAGTLYLLWLAWESWRAAAQPVRIEPAFSPRYFRRGFITNVLNPKAALFYLSMLPSFIDTAHAVLPQTVMLTALYVLVATLAHSLIALLGSQAHGIMSHPQRAKSAHRLFAGLLLFTAVWFAWSTHPAA